MKTTESGGASGYDAGKKIKGRKRHIVTDTLGFLLIVLIHAADIQDRDGAPMALKSMRHRFPWLRHVFADGGYAGDKLRRARHGHGDWTVEIIKRSDSAKGFEAPPRRWVVGTDLRLARPLPPPRQGLGAIHQKRNSMDPHRQHPDAHPAHRKILRPFMNF